MKKQRLFRFEYQALGQDFRIRQKSEAGANAGSCLVKSNGKIEELVQTFSLFHQKTVHFDSF